MTGSSRSLAPKRILVLYAGGTIGMVLGKHGYAPGTALPDYVRKLTTHQPELCGHEWLIQSVEPLLDSANARPADWYGLARCLWQARERIDGAVILHGTDTLAYATSFLSFLMQGYARPVVFTASQRPLGAAHSDAPANLLSALRYALLPALNEVALCFGSQLLRGNRIIKQGPSPEDGFVSPHWPALGHCLPEPVLNHVALLKADSRNVAPVSQDSARVGLLRLYPGMDATVVDAVGAAHPQGLVLEMYGVGTGPGIDSDLCAALSRLASVGTPIVGVSQCPYAPVHDLGAYESGQAFADSGVIAGADLTASAAFAKLHYLAGRGGLQGHAEWKAAIESPLAGELSL